MDSRMPQSNEGFANNHLFADSQHFNAYDNLNLFPNGAESSFTDASWSLTPTDYPAPQSRGQPQPVPSWQQNANHLSAQPAHGGFSGQPSSYGRSLNHSPVPYDQNTFNNTFGDQPNFPYRQTQYDPSLVTQTGGGQDFNVGVRGFNSPAPNGGTITPQALERAGTSSNFSAGLFPSNGLISNFGQASSSRPVPTVQQARPVDQKALVASVPTGVDSGMFSIINFDELSRATNSERMGNFISIGKEPLEWECTRSALPAYNHRRSRNDIRAAAAAMGNTGVLAKIGKKSLNAKTSALNNARAFGTSVSSPQQIKYEQESSSTEDSSDDDSAYSEDDESDSPLPTKRPDNPKGGVEYDTIKALWRSKRRTLNGDAIRKSLVDFWELVKTIRDRWKADTQAVTEAVEKKRTGEIPLLESRVKDQRDMIEAAFRAALKHGHRAIIELLSENVSLLYLCYQFLLDRMKAEDVNGGLARAILETMSLFTTLTKDKIDKTHLVKVFPRYLKKGDAKAQYWVKKINSNAETATKAVPEKSDPKKTDKPTAASIEQKVASPARKSAPEPVAGVKRAATSTSVDGGVQKKVAVGVPISNGAQAVTKTNGVVKKPGIGNEGSKPATAAPVATRKTVVAKPSGFFSNLQSASKKPGTSLTDKSAASAVKVVTSKPAGSTASAPKPTFSFAETMANLSKPKEEKPAPKPQKEAPVETEEERRERLRKEERRKLHVHFKAAEELVEIRYFTHDPQEEIDHDSSQMRDVADVGGEGRMFKQQSQMMDIDDEDDLEEVENLRDYTAPSLIDFSAVDEEERKRNYAPYGGGRLETESTERAVREQYESNNLIVIYTDRGQIPPDPREPLDPYHGEQAAPVKYFAPPEPKYAARALAKKGQQQSNPAAFAQYTDKQPGATSNPDIQSILASLRPTTPGQATQASHQPSAPSFSQQYIGAQGNVGFQAPALPAASAPPANIDLAAILASLNPASAQQTNYTLPGSNPSMGLSQVPQIGAVGLNDTDSAKMRAKQHPNYKTKVCRFWQEGRCQKGDGCSFLHE